MVYIANDGTFRDIKSYSHTVIVIESIFILISKRSYCKARPHTKGNNVIAKKNTHYHENNPLIFYNCQAKAGMKRKACESQELTHSIMTTNIGQLSEESAVHPPKYPEENYS